VPLSFNAIDITIVARIFLLTSGTRLVKVVWLYIQFIRDMAIYQGPKWFVANGWNNIINSIGLVKIVIIIVIVEMSNETRILKRYLMSGWMAVSTL
jgi:hypothetical protein